MNQKNWHSREGWVAYFDILGFGQVSKQNVDSMEPFILKSQIDEVIDSLKDEISHCDNLVNFLFYADTFVLFSDGKHEAADVPLLFISQRFIFNCISKSLPIRGAISYGNYETGHDEKILMGPAAMDGYNYGEKQNWLGLILTPAAETKLRSINFNIGSMGFVNYNVPIQITDKGSIITKSEKLFAYRFFPGGANTAQSSLLPYLQTMQSKAPEKIRVKYEHTIQFIQSLKS